MHRLILNESNKLNGRVITIGNYDGVHLGHQHVIKQCLKRAQEKQALASVLVFEPHPQQYFRQGLDAPMTRITSFRQRYEHLKQQGVQELLCHPFNGRVADLSPEAFVVDVLCNQLNMIHLVVGEDFHFGKARSGDFSLLQRLSPKHGFTVESAETLYCNQRRISSSLIRQLLAVGDFPSANRKLGRPFYLEGKVIHGEKRARLLGFPTANIHLKNKPQAVRGVYVVAVEGVKENATYPAVANVGVRPTVDGKRWLLEVHLLDEEGMDLYGKRLRVIFKKKLRDEQCFSGITALQQQIEQDVAQAKAYNAALLAEE